MIPAHVPPPHRRFLARAIERLGADTRILGIGAGGSLALGSMDEFSDLDLVIAIDPDHYDRVISERVAVAESLGQLLAAFTGEHVGEPRLLVCLYEMPLLHVDLKFVSMKDVAARVEDPLILWERDGRLGEALERERPEFPEPDRQWIEDRFWVWVHYAATKIGRGELFEAENFLAFLRTTVLGPLALAEAGARPSGVRKLEAEAPEFARALQATLASYDAADCARALQRSVDLYRSLREPGGVELRARAETAAVQYLRELESRVIAPK